MSYVILAEDGVRVVAIADSRGRLRDCRKIQGDMRTGAYILATGRVAEATARNIPVRRTQSLADKITVYEKPTCTKCREADRLLRESGIDYEKVNYYLEPIGEAKLRELIAKMRISPRELLRTGERVYRELGLGKRELSDDEIIHLMVEHPDLVQRPIVERGPRAVLGRPTERIKELL